MTYDRDYGALGRIGIVTPQANPTVEPELRLLLPARVSMVVARCVSNGTPPERLRDYFEHLGETLQRFDSMPLDAVGFACTGSSYLLGHEEERQAIDELAARCGYPVVTAAQAIDAALQHIGAHRIALACPYPQWLFDAAQQFWTARGYEIVASGSVQADSGDTRSIYALQHASAGRAMRELFSGADADALLITGTGMPSLRLVSELTEAHGRPVLSSNLCLAWQCMQAAGIEETERRPDAAFPILGGWQDSVDRL